MLMTNIPDFPILIFAYQVKLKLKTNDKSVFEKSLYKYLILLILILFCEGNRIYVFAQADKNTVAVVNEKKITMSDIEFLIPSQYVISEPEQLYAVRKVALDNYIIKILLKNEATRRKISVENLRKIMCSGNVEIPNEKVEKEYSANAPFLALMSPDEAKERIRLDLENEAKIQLYKKSLLQLRAKAKIKVFLKEPLLLEKIKRKAPPSRGLDSAKVIITEYADFRCPYCRESQGILKEILTTFKDDVKLIYKHLPLQTDLQSLTPAIVAYCAGEQDRFWEFHDILFSSGDLSANSIKQAASALNLDFPKFESCVSSEDSRFTVLSDLKDAAQLGITGTPTFIVNGKIISGKLSFSEFSKIIEDELKSIRRKANNQSN